MTGEEIIKEIKSILEELGYPDAVSYLTQNDREWLEATIKALEQEPFMNKPCVAHKVCHEDKVKAFDKIRTEIVQNAYPIVHGVNNHEKGMTLYGILQIIDKYKAESEDKAE